MSYVTFDASKDMLGVFGDILTGDKDYKVVQDLGKGLQIIGDHGQTAVINKSFFYENTLPESVYEGFENLVYVEPDKDILKDRSGKYMLDLRDISKDQYNYFCSVLKVVNDCSSNTTPNHLYYPNGHGFWGHGVHRDDSDIKLSFNDLFKEIK
ncbi:hypothetical protein VPHG_00017 [Vibrio phage 11895-B1]|uniref:hypothetical protein n=1 Tax=Vibrio phage 11895-B1 TaxID=754075 RepID=UPI0002C0AC52|nr:hypothetical protein VPHG_00017 [Vibrio phage 11895-B1]AGH32084.1 hypothetical protein VPHG_00017 [Vibrio phage 11895-B1]